MNKYRFSDARRAEIAASKRALFKWHRVSDGCDPVANRQRLESEQRRQDDLIRYAAALGRKRGQLERDLHEWQATPEWHEAGNATVSFQRCKLRAGRYSWATPTTEPFGEIIAVECRYLDWTPEEPVEEQ